MRIHTLAVTMIAISLLAGACAAAEATAPDEPVDAAPDDDVAGEPGIGDDDNTDNVGDDFPSDTAREDARVYLGAFEGDLPDDVRIARRGEERFMLTEDYVLGRSTVELDQDHGDGFRVVSVTVELPDGPETFHLEAS